WELVFLRGPDATSACRARHMCGRGTQGLGAVLTWHASSERTRGASSAAPRHGNAPACVSPNVRLRLICGHDRSPFGNVYIKRAFLHGTCQAKKCYAEIRSQRSQ